MWQHGRIPSLYSVSRAEAQQVGHEHAHCPMTQRIITPSHHWGPKGVATKGTVPLAFGGSTQQVVSPTPWPRPKAWSPAGVGTPGCPPLEGLRGVTSPEEEQLLPRHGGLGSGPRRVPELQAACVWTLVSSLPSNPTHQAHPPRDP